MSASAAVLNGLTRDLNAFLDKHKSTVVWGAGHQALAVLAATGVRDKIAYVVDSAPFKQEKLTPATHLPVRHPDCLKENPPDAVIVATAAYASEVVSFLKKHYGGTFDVAVLNACKLETVFEKITDR